MKKLIPLIALTVLVLGLVVYSQIKEKTVACANSISCIKDISGTYESTSTGEFMGKSVKPMEETQPIATNTLGEQSGGNKHIFVDLATQHLYAYENDTKVYDFPVSTGKWGRTPTGDFKIWIKLKYTRMTGGNSAIGTYYNLPNVPYTMYFYNDEIPATRGYGIHGAYWHDNFGNPMSHGCINMKPEDAETLFYWAEPQIDPSVYSTRIAANEPSTPITIYGTAPSE